MKRAWRLGLLAWAVSLAACTSDLAVPTEPLRLLRTEWGVAYVGEPFDGALRPTGGLRPYRFELADGALPPGLAFAAGRLVGTPTEVGRFAFTVQVQDGNLSQALQRVELDVRPLPTPLVRIDAPATEVRGVVPLVVRIEAARGWRGARIAIVWDPEAFALAAGPNASDARLALFHDAAEGRLWLETAALGPARQGDFTLARFSLRPIDPPARLSLAVSAATRYAGGEHLATRIEGAPQSRGAPGEAVAPGEAGAPGKDEPDEDESNEGEEETP